MGKSSPSPPAAPDPVKTAAAQGALNKEAILESARVNQLNQISPYANVAYTGEIGEPSRTQTLTLPSVVQETLDTQNRIAGGVSGFAEDFIPSATSGLSAGPFRTADYGPAPVASPEERARIEEALFARLNPQIKIDENSLRNRLAVQGIPLGSEAFGQEIDAFDRSKTDARLATIGAAGGEYARDFGLQQQAYQQQLADALLDRTQGVAEMRGLLGISPAFNQPSAPGIQQYNIQPGDFQGAQALQFAGQQNRYNQQLANRNATFGGLAGLGGSLGAAAIRASGPWSDVRVKTDIKRVGTLDSGLGVYTFRYKWGGPVQMGVMAQEVEKINPAAVGTTSGIKHVNYGAL